MTVQELIVELKKQPQDAKVLLSVSNGAYDFEGESIEVDWINSEQIVCVFSFAGSRDW